MTLLEKAMAEHTGLDEDKIISFMCPCDLGYEKLDDGCNQMAASGTEACRVCWNRQADAAGGGESQIVCSAAVEKCEEKREPEAFFGNRKAAREAGDTSSALRAPSPQGEGKAPPPGAEEGAAAFPQPRNWRPVAEQGRELHCGKEGRGKEGGRTGEGGSENGG